MTHPKTWQIALPTEADTVRFATSLAGLLQAGDCLALSGNLGAGKTTFARGLIEALYTAYSLTPPAIPSPTFALLNVYDLPTFPLWHMDFYRLQASEELWELGWEDALISGAHQPVLVLEWADKYLEMLPKTRVDMHFIGSAPRTVQISLRGNWGEENFPRMHILQELLNGFALPN